jgi:flavin reductase (DIM6/NTAB) family NADH-FMN oxidoreductase RutF
MNLTPGEMLRRAMRHWATGVAVVTSRSGDAAHGMTVNSFVSVSLDPPLVTVTMEHSTRTYALVQESGVFAVTVLGRRQQHLADLFAGRQQEVEGQDRMAGLDTFTMVTGAPLLRGGIAFVDCQVVHAHGLRHATLLFGQVLAAQPAGNEPPLVYYNRTWTGLI